MRRRLGFAVASVLLAAAGCRQAGPPAAAPPADPTLRANLDAAVLAHRRVIVLVEDASLSAADRARAELLGRVLYEQNRHRLQVLETRLGAELTAGRPAPSVAAFLDALEREPDWRDADKLVFRDLLGELLAASAEPGRTAPPAIATRLREDDAALRQIQALYEKELERVFGRLATRGMTVRRETWESYIAFLRSRMRAKDILDELGSLIAGAGETMRGGESAAEITGARLPRKSLVLTFDDGPHPRHTEKIQAILDRFSVKALFFNVGENLGALAGDDTLKSTPAAAASRKLYKDGFLLANHSYSHAFLPKLDDAQLGKEIELTNRLLKDVDPGAIALFRAPYGARDARVLAAIQARGMKSVMWNIDSRDWADPVPASIANRVIQTAEGEGRGIILFHDIQARTVEALPMVIETLLARGYRFLAWNGAEFVGSGAAAPVVAARSGASPAANAPVAPASGPLYRESHAVVIGIDDYKHWPRLSYAVNDARAVRDLLVEKQRFKPENVALLLNADATRERILYELGDRLADPKRVAREDRVFVFFAGHGATRRLPNGRSLGYIIPVEAGQAEYQSQAVSMTNFQDVSEAIPAKHVLYVTDACYSGVALTRGGGDPSGAYLKEMGRRTVRQILTAGGADQEVADNGPNGHSIFTWALLQGLEGRADLSGDGYVTGAELGAYVGPTVSALSRQTPAFGNLVGSEGGEFVFELRHDNEFLSDVSSQLDDEAVTLNARLEKIRAEIAKKQARNEALKRELLQAEAALGAPKAAPATAPPESAAQRNDRGMTLYRERHTPEALAEFEAAARMAPSVALYANNVGFAQFKLGRLEESVRSFRRTLELDPKRAVAALNLGDALMALSRGDEARAAYDTYLELAPNAKNAAEVRAKRDASK